MNRGDVSILTAGTIVAVAAICLSATPVAQANGVIICPRPHPHPHPLPRRRPIHTWSPFAIASQRVDVQINDLAAETSIEQVFVNRAGRQVEGTYLFPISRHAAVHNFSMWMNGREVSAELLDADKARRIYESIVSRMKDPALLQFAGCGLIQAKVFPIPAGGECRIKLKYSELLESDAGLTGYRFPLGAAGGDRRPIEQFSLRVVVRTSQPLTSVFSPSHECSIDRRSDHEVVVGLEKTRLAPDNDFQLFFKAGTEAFGLSLLTYRRPGEDGFFLARISPSAIGGRDAAMPKNICFVLDTSGSMADDDKIAQAKRALKFCITNLGREDRFCLITFSTEVRPFRDDWSPTDGATLDAAKTFIDGLKAVGGTDINGALQRALSMNPKGGPAVHSAAGIDASWRKNPYFIVFVTDGKPTVGVTEPAKILANVAAARAASDARVFVLGIGYQINTKLLDRLADDNGGARGYVTPAEDLKLKMSSFYTKLANPVLASLKLTFEGVSVHDLYPRRLPDLFRGSELVVAGRYTGGPSGSQGATLTGTSRGESRTFSYPCHFASGSQSHEFLPRFWAVRKIGYLLDQLRLHGQTKELRDEVVRLSTKYGILTPYTSFLVQKDEEIARRSGLTPVSTAPALRALRGAFARNQAEMLDGADAQEASTGRISVGASRGNLRLKRSRPAGAGRLLGDIQAFQRDDAGRQLINFVGPKTFYLQDGRWIDAEYDGKTTPEILKLYSREYFSFVNANPEAGQFLAQADRVLLCWGGQIYETVPEDDDETPAP